MTDPIISIVIPCFNHGEYLEETLESVSLNKKNYSVEIIIVNDGSTDPKTLEVFKKVESQGYFVLHQENQGLAKARNNGIRVSKGKYILPLDSDNRVSFHYLNTAIDIFEKQKDLEIVYGNALYIGEKSGVWKNQLLDKRRMLFANDIDACAVFRKSTWTKLGGYSEDMPYMGCEDWNFWLKGINNNCKFHYLDEICFEYRVLSNSMIRTVPEDFNAKIFSYNTLNLYDLYSKSLRNDHDKFQNIFTGNVVKKIAKTTLNHFKFYRY